MSTPLNINNVVSISVSSPPSGLAAFAVNNLAIGTRETPVNGAITSTAPGVYVSPTDVATDWGTASEVYAMANAIFAQSPNILTGGGQLIIYPMGASETIAQAVAALSPQMFIGGFLYAGYAPTDADLIAGAAACEPLRIKLFASSYLKTALTATTGVFDIISTANDHHCRMILYTLSDAAAARLTAAAYAGRAMSTNFEGSATTSTMHLKELVGVTADPNITQADLTRCGVVGVDVVASIGGLTKVFSSGGNDFFDNVYNLDWLFFALQVAGFNALAETSTKLPQTEPGIAVLRGAYINVLQQGVRNGFIAPGAWNSSELFGNPDDLRRNVAQLGYYIYSQPVNQQSQASRANRQAPLIQIAVKFAGAVHSTSVVVAVNP